MNRVIPIRASSFGNYLDCGYRWEAEILLGMRKRAGIRMWLGQVIHHATALYDQSRIDGLPISVDDAAGEMVNMLWHPDETLEADPKFSMREAERVALALLSRYCKEIAPTQNYLSVEMPLKPLRIDLGGGWVLEFTGTMDRARVSVTLNGDVVTDLKSGGRLISSETGLVNVKTHIAQTGIYQLLKENTDGRHTIGSQIAALQTSSKPQIGMSHIFNAKAAMLGDENRPGLIEIAGNALKAGVFLPNNRSQFCSKKFCVRWDSCAFHD